MVEAINKLKVKYNKGLNIHSERTDNTELSTIERNRSSYLANQIRCFLFDLDDLEKEIKLSEHK